MKHNHTNVRFSHLLGYSGVGAIVVDDKNEYIIIEDITKWTSKDGKLPEMISYVDRVKRALDLGDIDLRMPPMAHLEQNQDGRGEYINGTAIPAKKFPTVRFCKKCGKLYSKKAYNELLEKRCDHNDCHGELKQVPFVMVHPGGYISDVNWKYHTHIASENHSCESSDNLFLRQNEEGWYLFCEECGAKAKFTGREEGLSMGSRSQQPWHNVPNIPEEDQKDGKAKIRKINDISIYSCEAKSALIIPPESRYSAKPKQGSDTLLENLYRHQDDLKAIESELKKADNPLKKRHCYSIWARKYGVKKEELEKAYDQIISGQYPSGSQEDTKNDGGLREDEYKAFQDKNFHPEENEDFVIQHQPTSDKYPVSTLVKASRLKEVKVFLGFRRDLGEKLVPPDIDGTSGWLPAIELWGEGIFFTLDETLIREWEKLPRVVQLFKELQKKYIESNLKNPEQGSLTPRFVLLHTLSHLMIRQLENLAGYPAASIKEVIYSKSGADPMSGILIYTTAPDRVGTLGGLIELTEPKKFYNLLENALNQARWCSSDPVCGEHELHGPHSLNRSACHACVLLPETSCEFGNILLDRQFVIEFLNLIQGENNAC